MQYKLSRKRSEDVRRTERKRLFDYFASVLAPSGTAVNYNAYLPNIRKFPSFKITSPFSFTKSSLFNFVRE